MKRCFKYIEGLTRADIAFEAFGNTLEEVFEESANAVFDTQAETSTIEAKKAIPISIQAIDPEQLLIDFLNLILFYKDADQLIFKQSNVKIKQAEMWELNGEFKGDFLDTDKHELKNDIKAITYHEFELKQIDGGWRAQVVVDI